jgi:2-methylcitrate dehydratase PrpD
VEGLLDLMQGITPDMVESVVVTGPPVTVRLCGRPDLPDPSPNYARLCMSYVAAKVLLNGGIDLAHYRGDELTDPATHALAQRVTMRSDGGTNPNALVPVSVEMTLKGGEVRHWRCTEMLASPGRRLSRDQHLAKFRRCWEFAQTPLPEQSREALIRMVDALETVEDVRELIALLTP